MNRQHFTAIALLSIALAGGAEYAAAQDEAHLSVSGSAVTYDDSVAPPTRDKRVFAVLPPPRPLDVYVNIEPDSWLDGTGIWGYSDDGGRVRASVETAGDRTRAKGLVEVWWSQDFQQNTADETPGYFVNPTLLEYVLGKEAAFYFGVFLGCYDTRQDLEQGRFLWQRNVFRQKSRIGKRAFEDGYFHSTGELDGVDVSPGPLLIDEQIIVPANGRSASAVKRTTLGFAGDIDLSDCGIGRFYRITYILRSSAEDQEAESSAKAFAGDPLEPDSGFVLSPTTAPEETVETQFCAGSTDPGRFLFNGDGTVTDLQTALMWQRCPLGFGFDDGGTPANLADDHCVAGSTPAVSWQDALAGAAADIAAGQSDWRLPNVKELDSIVDLACAAPALVQGVFPDAPLTAYWSSTPGGFDTKASKAIDMQYGRIASPSRDTLGHALAVRDTGLLPVAPPVAVKIGNAASVEEGDATGGNELVFPVRLSRAAAQDVSLSFRSVDVSALAGEDYAETTGTLVVPAGAVSADIRVPVLGDSVTEADEILEMNLLSASSNAYLVGTTASGQINDDEPAITVLAAETYEGAPGETAELEFLVRLDRPASSEIVFEYSVIDDTATFADNDYVPSSGVVTISIGMDSAQFAVQVNGDAAIEGDERIRVNLLAPDAGNATQAQATVYGVIVEDDPGAALALNDTGHTWCASEFSGFSSCPQADYPGQDAEFGRDSTDDDDTDGYAGMILTKLDALGLPLADQSVAYVDTPWDCVQDEVTGLMWEVKTDDGGLRDRGWDYSWYVSTGIDDGGDPGVPNGGSCGGGIPCDTESYAAAVNAAGLCGYADWRVPNRDELLSLDINLAGTVAVDEAYFPNANVLPWNWWTSTPAITWSADGLAYDSAWYANMFNAVSASPSPKSSPLRVRVVRTAVSQ